MCLNSLLPLTTSLYSHSSADPEVMECWIHLTQDPGGFPFPIQQSCMQDDCPVGPMALCRSRQGMCSAHVPHRETHVHTHTHRMVEIGFMAQRTGLGFKKGAGQRAMVRHRAWMGEGTGQQPAHTHASAFHPSSLLVPVQESKEQGEKFCSP